jgi:hypothetical protein
MLRCLAAHAPAHLQNPHTQPDFIAVSNAQKQRTISRSKRAAETTSLKRVAETTSLERVAETTGLNGLQKQQVSNGLQKQQDSTQNCRAARHYSTLHVKFRSLDGG